MSPRRLATMMLAITLSGCAGDRPIFENAVKLDRMTVNVYVGGKLEGTTDEQRQRIGAELEKLGFSPDQTPALWAYFCRRPGGDVADELVQLGYSAAQTPALVAYFSALRERWGALGCGSSGPA